MRANEKPISMVISSRIQQEVRQETKTRERERERERETRTKMKKEGKIREKPR